MIKKYALFASILLVIGCEQLENQTYQSATLYRNSELSYSLRLHVATFNAKENSNSYNIENCKMAARLYNANVNAINPDKVVQDVGFWCEPGQYKEDGIPPLIFKAEFPTISE